ncbi:TauD/TfdA family dioxygenase [Thalassolituus maritimus]
MKTPEGMTHHQLTPFISMYTPASESDKNKLSEFIADNRSQFMDVLQSRGCVVFRGFTPVGTEAFEDFVTDTLQIDSWNAFNSKGTPKAVANWLRKWSEKVLGAGDYRRYLGKATVQLGPVENSIQGPHVEGGGLIKRSRYLTLYCDEPGQERAETGMADFSSVYQQLPLALQEKLRSGWNEYLYTTSRPLKLLDKILLRLSPMSCSIDEKGFGLIKGAPCPAVAIVPGTDDIAVQPWAFARNANPQVLKAAQDVFSGRGELTTDSTADALNMRWDVVDKEGESQGWSPQEQYTLFKTIFSNAHLMEWQKGDIALVDNVRMGHWRMDGIQGKRRLIQIQSTPIDITEHTVPDTNPETDALPA